MWLGIARRFGPLLQRRGLAEARVAGGFREGRGSKVFLANRPPRNTLSGRSFLGLPPWPLVRAFSRVPCSDQTEEQDAGTLHATARQGSSGAKEVVHETEFSMSQTSLNPTGTDVNQPRDDSNDVKGQNSALVARSPAAPNTLPSVGHPHGLGLIDRLDPNLLDEDSRMQFAMANRQLRLDNLKKGDAWSEVCISSSPHRETMAWPTISLTFGVSISMAGRSNPFKTTPLHSFDPRIVPVRQYFDLCGQIFRFFSHGSQRHVQ